MTDINYRYPCILDVLSDTIVSSIDPIIVTIRVKNGRLRKHVPLCFVNHFGEIVEIGSVEQMTIDKQDIDIAEKGEFVVCVIQTKKAVIDGIDIIYTFLDRESLDELKTISNQLTDDEKICCAKIKKQLKFQ
jgi:translation initiation factor IF-2